MVKKKQKKVAPQRLKLSVPTKDAFAELVRDLNLDGEQAWALGVTLRHVAQDFEDYEAMRARLPPTGRLKSRLKALEKQLGLLREEMDRAAADMIHFLPHDTLARIGLAMNFTTIGAALGEDVFPKREDDKIRALISEGTGITLAQMEMRTTPYREVLGLKRGDQILRHFIGAIHDPLKLWVELDKRNPGGQTAEPIRWRLVYWLAWSAPEIIGRDAAIAKGGPFVRLCAAVLRACGESDEGIEGAVPEIVQRVREDMEKAGVSKKAKEKAKE